MAEVCQVVDRAFQGFQPGNNLTWLGTIGGNITQADDAIYVFCLEIAQDRF